MRRRREFHSRSMYDICFRAVQGLPLPPRELTWLLIESIIARILSSSAVLVCNYVWMSNHPHMQLFSLDKQAFSDFHGRLKKQLTDSLKRLLAIPRLNLWIDRTTTAEVLDLNAAINRVVYSFSNPVRARKARSIDTYRGCNTWKEFLSVQPDLNAYVEKEVPWILTTDIQPLSQANPSYTEEHRVITFLRRKARSRCSHTLRIYPLKWLEPFGITDSQDIEKIRADIIRRVRAEEAALSTQHFFEDQREAFDVSDTYRPPPQERSVYFYGSTKEVRLPFIKNSDTFNADCRACFLLMKQGHSSIPWPPECFIPPQPSLYNPIA